VTQQTEIWRGQFGKDYTDRNPHTVEELDAIYEKRFGLTRTAMNRMFLGELPRALKILEVGCGVGTQLRALETMGFRDLHGMDVQPYAVQEAIRCNPELDICEGSAFDIPWAGGSFDLVFTSGVLIHIAPSDLPIVLGEICRCSSKYIWGFEYFADEWTTINYRGHVDLLWKADYAREYFKRFSARILDERYFDYKDGSGNRDCMFLLKKGGT